MPYLPVFDDAQVREQANDILRALVALTNCPVFDLENADELDPMTQQTLVMCNTVILNATYPYLPFREKDIAPPV